MRSLAAVLIAAVAAVPAPAAAQTAEGGTILNLLRVQERLTTGQEARGALSAADWLDVRDHYLDVWGFEGRAGQRVTIDLISDDFDALLFVTGPGFAETLSDDDGGGGCNARLEVTFLENGMFRVVASSTRSRDTGVYTLRVSEGDVPVQDYRCGGINPLALQELPTDGRVLQFGQPATGMLGPEDRVTGERPVQAWTLSGEAGQSVAVTLRSGAYDAYLYIVGPGLGEVLEDDDGAGDLDSRIEFTFPETGTYRVIASSISSGARGRYELTAGPSRRVGDLADMEPTGTIAAGRPVEGMLDPDGPTYDEGRAVQAWAFEGTAGQRITISLESEDFDAYLYFVGPGIRRPMSNDDGGEGYNSELDVTLPSSGTYLVVASALGAGRRGAYRLTVTARP